MDKHSFQMEHSPRGAEASFSLGWVGHGGGFTIEEGHAGKLVMEIGDTLWLARATPRGWLEQGKKISVKHAPTFFGPVTYEIASDVDNGKINAVVEIPSRNPAQYVFLRLRHPNSAPIKAVTVNGKEWNQFDAGKETIELT